LGSDAVERLGDVGDDILWVFNADRQSDKGARDSGGGLLFRIELATRRRARMNREAVRIANIGEMVESFSRSMKATAAVSPPFGSKPTRPPCPNFRYLSARFLSRPVCRPG
jgi:hypothetical protein